MHAKKLLFLILVISSGNIINAQDIILKNDGQKIEGKIKEIGLNIIKYKKWNNLQGPVYNIEKENVQSITYENGTQDIFNKKSDKVKK